MRRFEICEQTGDGEEMVEEGVVFSTGISMARRVGAAIAVSRDYDETTALLNQPGFRWRDPPDVHQGCPKHLGHRELECTECKAAELARVAEHPANRILDIRERILERMKKRARRDEHFERYRREYEQAATLEAIVEYLEEQYSAEVPVVRLTRRGGS